MANKRAIMPTITKIFLKFRDSNGNNNNNIPKSNNNNKNIWEFD